MLGIAQIANGRYEAAIATLRREETYDTVSRRTLAVALALAGQIEESKREAQVFLRDNPKWRISHWIEMHPAKFQKDEQFWIDAYRLTGLPE
jgi:hypothetical protein